MKLGLEPFITADTVRALNRPFNGGYVSSLALIGSPPEMRLWQEGAAIYCVHIGQGCRIEAFVTVDAGFEEHTEIGNETWLMKHVHVGHDAKIGDRCELAPGTVIGGYAVLGSGVKMGVNASVRPYTRVGDGARVGAGAVVVQDVPENEVWVGNPARKLRDV